MNEKMTASVTRINKTLARFDDPKPTNILSYHAVVEGEMDAAIAAMVRHPDYLRGLGFGQKVGVWAALSGENDDKLAHTVRVLIKLNDLRNAVAHFDDDATLIRSENALINKVREKAEFVTDLSGVASYLVGIFYHSEGPVGQGGAK